MQEKMQHSIIKWWNVHYMTPQELEEAAAQEEPEPEQCEDTDESQEEPVQSAQTMEMPDLPKQQNVVDQMLQAQTAEAEAAQEILDRLQREAEEDDAKLQQEIEQAKHDAEQIQTILSRKEDALRELIERTEDQE